MTNLLIIGAGGFLGAISRYGLSTWLHKMYEGSFPLGTFAVNVLGCLLIGGLMHWTQAREDVSPAVRLFLGIGILGSFTTFSTFGFETLDLMQKGAWGTAGLYVAGNVILGLAAVWCGFAAMKAASA